MVTLVKGQPVAVAPGYVVATAGEYAETDLVPCALEADPDLPVAQFLGRQVAGLDEAAQAAGAVLSKLQFRRRFTLAERVAIDSNPLSGEAQAVVRTVLKDFDAAEEIRLDDPDVVAGVNALASFGLIAPSRVAEILRTP